VAYTVGKLIKSSTTFFQYTFPDSAVNLVKNSTQQKLLQISGSTDSSFFDFQNSQTRIAMRVILAVRETC
jgi:hypothetical protein